MSRAQTTIGDPTVNCVLSVSMACVIKTQVSRRNGDFFACASVGACACVCAHVCVFVCMTVCVRGCVRACVRACVWSVTLRSIRCVDVYMWVCMCVSVAYACRGV